MKEGLYELAENLANRGVEHEFRMENIGLDNKNNLKYFLGFAFRIDRSMKREVTLQRYKHAIDLIFSNR